MTTRTKPRVRGGIGEDVVRPDGIPKLTGNFAFASDLVADGMLWAATLRSPHAHAVIVSLDTTPALAIPGVRAVITQDDVPGHPLFGQEKADQPVLCDGVARYWGEPVAVVAADDPETARRGVEAIAIEWEPLAPVSDPEAAENSDHIFRRINVRRGDLGAKGEVVVEGYYEIGTQDQAPLGTEAGLAIPDGEGGIDLWVTSQWVHIDHGQIVRCLDLPDHMVRCHPAGIGGAFGAREDMSMHVHISLLALITRRPIKMVYDRSESFVGHVKRHSARMWYRHEATPEGRLVRVTAKVILDGGAYMHTSAAVTGNAAFFAVGPYVCDNVELDVVSVKTNNPPAGAMRGFGVVQTCFGAESQMDRLAQELDMEPLALRRLNALEAGQPFSTTGQIIEGAFPTTAIIDALESFPLPPPLESDDPVHLPGGTGLTTPRSAVVRGIGYALSAKNLAFSEGFDDYAEARVVLTPVGAEVHTAAMEVGQGLVTLLQQIARTVLGTGHVAVVWDDTSQIGSAGSTSASRQTQMTGGAVHAAAVALRDKVLDDHGADELREDGAYRDGERVATLEEICASGPVDHWIRFRHPETEEPDENGQGNLHPGYALAGHRAVVDVDPELGLVRVVQIDTAQDVGKVLNPKALMGQVEGGILQGVGLATMEELVIDKGIIRNPTFTDYLLPTSLDAPHVNAVFIEEGDHWGPFGAKGAGEPPTISSTPAVAAAIRQATGKALTRVPILPQDITGT